MPQEHAKIIIKYINLPHVRELLPVCVRAPLAAGPSTVSGFISNETATPTHQLPGENFWSSFGQSASTRKRMFESEPMTKANLPLLEFRVAGDLGQPGTSLAVFDLSNGKTTEVKPFEAPGRVWQSCRIPAPLGQFKLIATDDSAGGWFAFQFPREVGRLSYWAERLAKVGFGLLVIGIGLYMAGIACCCLRWWKSG